MERLFIFAIGGTGARLLRSFTMLLASGQPTLMNYDIYPIILDYDNDNGDTEIATEHIDNYKLIHDNIWKDERLNEEKGFFKSNLCPLDAQNGNSSFRMNYAPRGDEQFKEYIGFDTLGSDEMNSKRLDRTIDTRNTKMLLESLYNNDPTSDDSELYLGMKKGFKGNPNVGSVVFHDIDTECAEFRRFLINVQPTDKVIVIGSLFGGTGASGIPEIIRKIQARDNRIQIGAILVMPYFAPEPKEGGTIRYQIFNSKTKAAINYYHDCGLIKINNEGKLTESSIKTAYFIGDPKPTILKYCDGGANQRNPANVVEFVGALSIIHFLQGNAGCFKYGVSHNIVGDKVSVKQLFHDDFNDQVVKPIIKQLTSFTIAMKYFTFRTMIPPSSIFDNLSKTYYYKRFSFSSPKDNMKKLCEDLKSFWDAYKKWLDELSNKGKNDNQGNSHGLTLYNTDDNLEVLIVADAQNHRESTSKLANGKTIDGLINKAIKDFRPSGLSGHFITEDEEFLFMYGLYCACINDEVINKMFDK